MALVVRKKFLNTPIGDNGGASTTHVWMPLTTTNASGDPELVWNADDTLIPTFVPVGP